MRIDPGHPDLVELTLDEFLEWLPKPTDLIGGDRGPRREARSVCSCGCDRPHKIAERHTFDGLEVSGWSNGDLCVGSWEFHAHGIHIDDLWALLDVVSLYKYDELANAIVDARCGRLRRRAS